MKLVRFTEAMIIYPNGSYLWTFVEYKVAERFISKKKKRELFEEIKSANADMSNVE